MLPRLVIILVSLLGRVRPIQDSTGACDHTDLIVRVNENNDINQPGGYIRVAATTVKSLDLFLSAFISVRRRVFLRLQRRTNRSGIKMAPSTSIAVAVFAALCIASGSSKGGSFFHAACMLPHQLRSTGDSWPRQGGALFD